VRNKELMDSTAVDAFIPSDRQRPALSYAAAVVPVVNPWLHRYAVLVACCTFVLILVGSTVTTTGSGLAVPDWPTTYGQNMFVYPPSKWVGGIFYEHGHRLVASAVGLLTIVLCLWLWLSAAPTRWLKWLGTLALAAVCLQGLLGGLTVLLLLPPVVSIAHAGLAQIFFCLTVAIALLTAPRRTPRAVTALSPARRSLGRWAVVVMLGVYGQILAGALMRHSGSGLAITDFPLSYGRLLPPLSEETLAAINIQRSWELQLPAVTLAQTWIHFAHRAGAAVVALVLAVFVRRVFRDFGHDLRLAGLSTLLAVLLASQVVLGALTIWTQRSLAITTAHVGLGALMLAGALAAVLACRDRLQDGAAAATLNPTSASLLSGQRAAADCGSTLV
jgi:cytochrome c oxidase assembly protein subunit 15